LCLGEAPKLVCALWTRENFVPAVSRTVVSCLPSRINK